MTDRLTALNVTVEESEPLTGHHSPQVSAPHHSHKMRGANGFQKQNCILALGSVHGALDLWDVETWQRMCGRGKLLAGMQGVGEKGGKGLPLQYPLQGYTPRDLTNPYQALPSESTSSNSAIIWGLGGTFNTQTMGSAG